MVSFPSTVATLTVSYAAKDTSLTLSGLVANTMTERGSPPIMNTTQIMKAIGVKDPLGSQKNLEGGGSKSPCLRKRTLPEHS